MIIANDFRSVRQHYCTYISKGHYMRLRCNINSNGYATHRLHHLSTTITIDDDDDWITLTITLLRTIAHAHLWQLRNDGTMNSDALDFCSSFSSASIQPVNPAKFFGHI